MSVRRKARENEYATFSNFNYTCINHQTNTFLIKLFKNHSFAQKKNCRIFAKKKLQNFGLFEKL